MLSGKQIVDNLYMYDDYRLFLQEWFAAKRLERDSFSMREFSTRAGFAAHNFCNYLMKGERNCSVESARKLAVAIGLKSRAADFFENLVLYTQSETSADRDFYYAKMRQCNKASRFKNLELEQFPFYEHWYYPVLRELMVISVWEGDMQKLCDLVYPKITVSETAQAVEFLLATGMVIKGENGIYALPHIIVTSEQVPVYIKKKSRRDVLLKGADVIDLVHPTEKYLAYSTVSMSSSCFHDVRKILDDARETVLARIATDTDQDVVYEVVFQMFPVSRNSKKSSKSKGGHV